MTEGEFMLRLMAEKYAAIGEAAPKGSACRAACEATTKSALQSAEWFAQQGGKAQAKSEPKK
jgi:hypothetical protein